MTHDDAFIQAILEDPDDMSLRLIYADWLDERDDPRGQFIRTRVELDQYQENDPRRKELEDGNLGLMAKHREEWVQQCGLVMKWESALALFKQRLAEAVAWCGQGRGSLRTPDLRPPNEDFSGYSKVICEWQPIVNGLALDRARLLSRFAAMPTSLEKRGRLLLFYPEDTLADGAAEIESERFFDTFNVPAWDSWVFFVEDDLLRQNQRGDGMYLICWVPPTIVERAAGGVSINPEQCIRWATDVEDDFTRKLKKAHLLF
jgi:uncharacterized protein (TIGR02996 family)